MSTPSRVEIDAPARLHLGLIAMGNGGPRINGGLGFAIDMPSLSIVAESFSRVEVIDRRTEALRSSECKLLERLLLAVCNERDLEYLPRITICGDTPSHKGLGTGTAIRLAAIEATHILNGRFPTRTELIAQSRRGGTSGVGIRTYFQGGLTFDLGRKGTGGHKPSHDWESPLPPLELARIDMPDWDIGFCLAPDIPALTYEQERAVFASAAPVSEPEVQRTLHLALFGVFAAAAEHDLPSFAENIERLQSSVWKSAEWNAHGQTLLDVAALLRCAGARGIGLSSMGPGLFFCAESFVKDTLPEALQHSVVLAKSRNYGRRVLVDDFVLA